MQLLSGSLFTVDEQQVDGRVDWQWTGVGKCEASLEKWANACIAKASTKKMRETL